MVRLKTHSFMCRTLLALFWEDLETLGDEALLEDMSSCVIGGWMFL